MVGPVPEYIDIGRVLTLDELREVKDAGYAGVVPYLDPFNPKGATPQYLRDIATAGLLVPGFFYETTGGSGQPAYFSESQGKTDAAYAEVLLALVGHLVPKGVPVWYAADINIDPSLFTPYANGIAAIATSAQTPGIYGFQRLCDYARVEYPAFGKHLAQTYGAENASLELWQHEQVSINGIVVDLDDVRVPGWTPGGTDMEYVGKAEFEAYQADVKATIEGTDGGATVENGGLKGIINWLIDFAIADKQIDAGQQTQITAIRTALHQA